MHGRAMLESDGWVEDANVLVEYNRASRRAEMAGYRENRLKRMVELIMKDLINEPNRP